MIRFWWIWKRVPIDLLPDREEKTLEEWLKAHPGVEVVTRDRSAVYANAITTACPTSIQVADRWHLLKNLSENVEKLLDSQRSLIKEAAQELSQQKTEELKPHPSNHPSPVMPASSVMPGSGSNHQALQTPTVATGTVDTSTIETSPSEKRYDYYKQVKQLGQQGYSIKGIARHLDISRNTIRKYLSQESFAVKTRVKRSNIIQFEDYLRKRWNQGQNCVYTLYKEIKPMGYNGSYTRLTVFMAAYPRGAYPKGPSVAALPVAQKGATFSSRSLSIASLSITLCQKENQWAQDQKPLLNKLLQKSDLLRQTRNLCLEFKTMIEQKKGAELENWCQKASELSCLKGFVRGIRQDFQAVQQAMSLASDVF